MWLELTRPWGAKELFNMALCYNVEPAEDGSGMAQLRFQDGDADITCVVTETVADLKVALRAAGKPA